MELLIEDNKSIVIVVIVIEKISDGRTESERQVVAIATSADESVVSTEHFLPSIYQFLELSKVFEVHVL